MAGLRSLVGLTKEWTKGVASSGGSWFLDALSPQAGAQRFVEDGNYIQAERRLAQAALQAEKSNFSARRRMRLRLDLAEVQRRQANLPGCDPDGEWMAAAELSVRQALQLAAQSGDAPG